LQRCQRMWNSTKCL